MGMQVYKYHSCENSFLIMEYLPNKEFSLISQKLCDEYKTDGLLVYKINPFEMLVFNKDGSEANMCGNGIRCLFNYLFDFKFVDDVVDITTKAGIYQCKVVTKKPFISVVSLGTVDYKNEIIKQEILVNDKLFDITLLELGVLHAVVLDNNLDIDEKNAYEIFTHPLISGKANVNLVKPLNSNMFEIITYEKGVGFTKACGTGVGASGYVLHIEYNMDESLIAICPGGILKVDINDNIYLTGESNMIACYEVSI